MKIVDAHFVLMVLTNLYQQCLTLIHESLFSLHSTNLSCCFIFIYNKWMPLELFKEGRSLINIKFTLWKDWKKKTRWLLIPIAIYFLFMIWWLDSSLGARFQSGCSSQPLEDKRLKSPLHFTARPQGRNPNQNLSVSFLGRQNLINKWIYWCFFNKLHIR